jgi:hypothetical protein
VFLRIRFEQVDSDYKCVEVKGVIIKYLYSTISTLSSTWKRRNVLNRTNFRSCTKIEDCLQIKRLAFNTFLSSVRKTCVNVHRECVC